MHSSHHKQLASLEGFGVNLQRYDLDMLLWEFMRTNDDGSSGRKSEKKTISWGRLCSKYYLAVRGGTVESVPVMPLQDVYGGFKA